MAADRARYGDPPKPPGTSKLYKFSNSKSRMWRVRFHKVWFRFRTPTAERSTNARSSIWSSLRGIARFFQNRGAGAREKWCTLRRPLTGIVPGRKVRSSLTNRRA